MRSLRPDQLEAIDFLSSAQRAIHGDPPGAGKTAVAVRVLETWGPIRTLVVTPHLAGNGPRQWRDALEEWDPYNHVGQYLPGTGTPGRRLEARTAIKDAGGVYVTNYDLMRREVDALIDVEWDALVFDEAHRLADRNSAQTRAARKLAKRVPRLLHMTGTPYERPEDLWSLLHMIDPKRFSSFWAWANEHCVTEKRRFNHAKHDITLITGLRPGHEAEVREQLREVMIQRDLPWVFGREPEVTFIRVDLSPAERKLYDELTRRYLFTKPDGDVVIAPNEISRSTLQRRLVSDFSALVDAEHPGTKVRVACEHVDGLEEPVLLVAAYKQTVRTAAELLRGPGGVVTYHGDQSTADNSRALEAFRSGEAKVMVATIDSVKEGVDGIQDRCRRIVTIDRPWPLRYYEQLVGRVRRTGQTRQVYLDHVTARNTIDDDVARSHVAKMELRNALRVDGERSSEQEVSHPL